MNVGAPRWNVFEAVRAYYSAARLRDLFDAEGLRGRGSGAGRAKCPAGCDADKAIARGVTIGERDGCGVWHCKRDDSHKGTAIDLLMHTRGLSALDAAQELAKRAGLSEGTPLPPRAAPAVGTPAIQRLPPEEVAALWARCLPVSRDREVAGWIRDGRGLGAERLALVEARDLCRALPRDGVLPGWAAIGKPWPEAWGRYRAIFPMYDASGKLCTLRARGLRPDANPKAAAAAKGGPSGLVMANELGRMMLEGSGFAAGRVRELGLYIAEGEPDFMVYGTYWPDLAAAPATLGVVAGSWRQDFAGRVPHGTTVTIATHPDKTGEEYARGISDSLRGRRVRVKRLPRDANDALRGVDAESF